MNTKEFNQHNQGIIEAMPQDKDLQQVTKDWFAASSRHEYSYHFSWLGRPIIQFPQDIIAVQEIIWRVRPELIIETGIARGGSLIFHASILEMMGGNGRVVGVDIDIREHNRVEILKHPMSKRITMIQGSSIDEAVVQQVYKLAAGNKPILVILDSNHTHEHVLKELELYSPLVGQGSYLLVFDTVIEDMPAEFSRERPWGPGNNPKTALAEFLQRNDRFEVDREMESKLLITVAPGGYLKCIAD